MSKFCPRCGTELNDTQQYCHGCGSAFYAPEAPAPEPAFQPAKSQPRPTKRTRSVGAVLLCILLYGCCVGFILLMNLRTLTSQTVLQNTMENVVMNVDLTEIPAAEVIANADPDTSMAQWIADSIEKSYVVDVDIDENDVQEFLEDSSILPFIAEKASAYMDGIRTGSEDAAISEEELEDLLWDNRDEIEDLVGIPLTQSDVDKVVNQASSKGMLQAFQPQQLEQNVPAVYNVAQVGLSNGLLIGLVLLMLVLSVLVAACYRWNFGQACGSVGITLTVSSGFFVVVSLVGQLLSNSGNSLVMYVVKSILQSCMGVSLTIFILGVILIVVDQVTKKLQAS